MAGRNEGAIFPIVSARAKLTDPCGNSFCAVIHEALYDENLEQTESLLSTHQCKAVPTNRIDDNLESEFDKDGNRGTQKCYFGPHEIPLFFDGSICLYQIDHIDEHEAHSLPTIVLTSALGPYEPKRERKHTARATSATSVSMEQWRRRLGFAPKAVVEKTLKATTQFVTTVEAETRSIMRDHLMTRLPALKVTRINDDAYWDTFFSSITSVRGFTCWNLFALKQSHFNYVSLMKRKSSALPTVQGFATKIGAPRVLKSDNAPELTSKKVRAYLNSIHVPQEKTEPFHPNQNLSERRGGIVKSATVHLLAITGAPLEFWCYALEYVVEVGNHLARRSLNWRCALEALWGVTPDLSVFRFVFWQPVWYYNPRRGFPLSKMSKGRFLGIAKNVGDAFCYLILIEPSAPTETPQVIARSVVRSRTLLDDEVPLCGKRSGKLIIYKSDGVTPLPDVECEDTLNDVELSNAVEEMDLRNPGLSSDASTDSPRLFEESLRLVTGPRRGLSTTDSPPGETSDPLVFGSQTCTLHTNPEESPVEDIIREPTPVPAAPANSPTQVPTTPAPAPTNPSDLPDDDPVLGIPSVPEESGRVPLVETVPITQDDDDDDDNDPIGVEATEDTAAHFLNVANPDVEQELMEEIAGHEWKDGLLFFRIKWNTDEETELPFSVVKHDFPYQIATYILEHKVGGRGGKFTQGKEQRWARSVVRQANVAFRRFRRTWIDDLVTPEDLADPQSTYTVDTKVPSLTDKDKPPTCKTRRVNASRNPKKRKKPGRLRRPMKVKYGIVLPNSISEAYEIDRKTNTTFWKDALEKEIKSLLMMDCFEFHDPDFKPSSDYQYAPLRMVFEAKEDGRRKCRLVIFGHVVDSRGISSRSSVVKGVSVRMLDLLAHRDNLQILHGDVSNAFISAPCREKIYSRAGAEFGDREGAILILKKALYGLRSSSKAFRCCFADYLRTLGFFPTRYDRDVWMRLREDNEGYDYICTHVDDFKIVARDAFRWVAKIKEVFELKTVEPPRYYLGLDYTWDDACQMWTTSCATYIKECVRRIEAMPEFGKLHPKKVPMPEECHPEKDNSPLLDEKGVKLYQTLIGMAQWALLIGRLDISFAVSSLSQFNACPREGHLALAAHIFCYLKDHKERRILINSNPLRVDEVLKKSSFHPDFLEDYPDAREEARFEDTIYPESRGKELETSIFFDADHAHNTVSRRSISGIIVFVGSTPVQWTSKRQGCIATSTYCAEFVAMRSAVEEAIALRYMLRCLGVPVTEPTRLYGDNLGSIQSATIPDGELKKKHIAISYHFVREAVASKIIDCIHVFTHENWADLCTKALSRTPFQRLTRAVMHS